MEQQELELLQARLLRDKQRILRGRARLMKKAPATGSDIADRAADISEELVLSSLNTQDAHTLREIEMALRRLDKGDYGVCEACRQVISFRRLKILPHATRCIECQQEG